MANELNIGYAGSLSVYALIRRVSDAEVWDAANAAWATWADGSIGDYDVALADKGGDVYAADFPTGISAGTRVLVTFCEQQGGAPATDDFRLRGPVEFTWTGVLTESGAAGTGLVTAARAAYSPRLASVDSDLLNVLILAATAFLERVCHRTFASTTHTEVHDGDGQNVLILDHAPVDSITTITITDADGDETEIAGSEFRVHEGAAIVEFAPESTADYSSFPAGFRNISVVYIAGWATIPEDVQQACVELIEAAVEHEPAIASERMGDYTVAYRSAMEQLSPLTRGVIAHYRRILA